MKIEVEDIETCKKKISIEIPHGDYKKKVQSYYKKLGSEMNVPGFRKGKVPANILEKRFGPQVKKEVLTELLSERIAEAIEEKGLHAVSAPNLVEVNAEEGTDISVSATVEVLPDFEVKDYSGIELDMKVARTTDKEVDQVIEAQRQRHAKSIQVTDRGVQDKDYIKIDFKGTYQDELFEGGELKDHVVQVGSKMLMEGIDPQLIGMNPGEERDVQVKIPEEFVNKKIAGKEVNFHVHLQGIQVKELPELDDDFAKKADPRRNFESLKDMKEKIRDELQGYERTEARKKIKKPLAEKITEMNPLQVPEGLVEEQIKFMVQEAKKKENPGQAQEHSHDHDHDHDLPVSDADRKKHRDLALKILQQEFLMDRLARDLEIEVDENELNAEINTFVKLMGGTDAKKMKQEWAKNGTLGRLHNRMRRDKTLEALLDKVQIKEEIVDRKEIIADN